MSRSSELIFGWKSPSSKFNSAFDHQCIVWPRVSKRRFLLKAHQENYFSTNLDCLFQEWSGQFQIYQGRKVLLVLIRLRLSLFGSATPFCVLLEWGKQTGRWIGFTLIFYLSWALLSRFLRFDSARDTRNYHFNQHGTTGSSPISISLVGLFGPAKVSKISRVNQFSKDRDMPLCQDLWTSL